jgi:hypothetical protein
MRITNIFLLSFILILGSCTVYESVRDKITGANDMEVVNAGYSNWSEPPVNNSDVPEKGIDVAVIIENWPEGAVPAYIVYQNRKTLNANISTTSDMGIVINGRIVLASSVLQERSQRIDVSDRLAYVGPEGDTKFVEIKEWSRIEEQDEQ